MASLTWSNPRDLPYSDERAVVSLPCTPRSLQGEADAAAGGSLRILREHFRAAQDRNPANHRLQAHLYVCLPALERLIRATDHCA